MASSELWVKKTKPMSESYTENDVTTSIQGVTPGLSYAMNINIKRWIYDKSVDFREIFTHGHGTFGNLKNGDIVSIAIDSHKNDIYIDVNTKQFVHNKAHQCTQTDASSNDMSSNVTMRIVERITLKYFPIAKYFHLAIVLSKNRVDHI